MILEPLIALLLILMVLLARRQTQVEPTRLELLKAFVKRQKPKKPRPRPNSAV